MKTNLENKEKKTYSPPQINQIKLDNEISLVLESAIPVGEPTWPIAPEFSNNNPLLSPLPSIQEISF